MSINQDTRWRLDPLSAARCYACYTRDGGELYACQKCQRLHCLNHLRLVEWAIYTVARADDGPEGFATVKTARQEQSGVQHLVCVTCAGELARFG